jgi:hypothetical protein
MPEKTFHHNGAVFRVAHGEPEFDGGASHAVVEVDGCKAVKIIQKFTCGAPLQVTIPNAAQYRFGFVQVLRSCGRAGHYTDGRVLWEIRNLPLYDTSVRAENVVFPFTLESETRVVSGTKAPTPQFVYVRTNDRLCVGYPLTFPNEYLGIKDGETQKLLMVEEKGELTTWLVARDESLIGDMKLLALGVSLWAVDVEVYVDPKTGTVREGETQVNSSISNWEFCKDEETVPTLPAELAVLSQKQNWAPYNGAKVHLLRNLLPGNFYKQI